MRVPTFRDGTLAARLLTLEHLNGRFGLAGCESGKRQCVEIGRDLHLLRKTHIAIDLGRNSKARSLNPPNRCGGAGSRAGAEIWLIFAVEFEILCGSLRGDNATFGFHNFRYSLATYLISRGKDVKTIQELLRHAKVSTTLDLYSQAIDSAKLEAQEEVAVAITSTAAAD